MLKITGIHLKFVHFVKVLKKDKAPQSTENLENTNNLKGALPEPFLNYQN